jgi:aminoglycoside phosphotransferase (APT) family kinase protein
VTAVEVVDTPEQAAALTLAPLLVRRSLESFLDRHDLGRGEVSAVRIGDGHSNVTYLIERDGARVVLRRPPRPPLPPSAHDMLREAGLLQALDRAGVRVPHVLAVCEDETVLGVPFYVMAHVDGVVVTDALPPALDSPEERRRLGLELVDALAGIHAVDWRAAGLDGFGRETGYLERQLRRWTGLWEHNATRELPAFTDVGAWLQANLPVSPPATIVHGDYRLGNMLVAATAPARILAILDWELATIGDPLADLGYLVATYGEADAARTPLELSPVTRLPGFPTRAELAARYEELTGLPVASLAWYEALALWKAVVFCEAIYARQLRGEIAADDPFASSLADGVPRLLELAEETAARA